MQRANVAADSPSDPSGRAKRVLIVCQLDRVANSVKPIEVERFLRSRGYDVDLVDTYYLGRASSKAGSFRTRLPPATPKRFALYLVEAFSAIAGRWMFARRRLSYYGLVADQRLRRNILASSLALDDFDLIICETPHDVGVLTAPTRAQTLYDCPTPWADELYNDGRLTERQHEKFRHQEAEVFERVDHLAFHWETYACYALKHYGISGRNLMTLNWGCAPSPLRAEFRDPARIVYMGSLAGSAINLSLLSRLTKLYPNIDVYGVPPPDGDLGLNYLGWAPPSVLEQYQFGLVTLSDDELRREGFSAKHPQYLAYGLPVLVPSWRCHMELLRGSVPYDEETFLSVIEGLSHRAEWQRVSDEAYAQAQRLAWDETLRPLESLLDEL